ncbi:hypothetical protein EJB05_08401, partial [Eragrostis curvula]
LVRAVVPPEREAAAALQHAVPDAAGEGRREAEQPLRGLDQRALAERLLRQPRACEPVAPAAHHLVPLPPRSDLAPTPPRPATSAPIDTLLEPCDPASPMAGHDEATVVEQYFERHHHGNDKGKDSGASSNSTSGKSTTTAATPLRASVRDQSPKMQMIDSLFKPQGTEDDGLIRHANVFYSITFRACKFLETWCPKFTLIVAQKNRHTKFFLHGAPDNVPPGTVVDNGVCHSRNGDFYMCAHAGMTLYNISFMAFLLPVARSARNILKRMSLLLYSVGAYMLLVGMLHLSPMTIFCSGNNRVDQEMKVTGEE